MILLVSNQTPTGYHSIQAGHRERMKFVKLENFLLLQPEYRDYVWGGNRLRPQIVPTAEAWIIYEQDRIVSAPFTGRSLAELAEQFGPELLGQHVVQHTGLRFPLLIKLLDCAAWLSLQVHPDDQQALALEGPGQFGKTEAWHVLDAQPDARLIAGLKPGVTQAELETAIRSGRILDVAQYLDVHTGDTLFMPPGTIHALGPGLLIYEVQETSDLTYRVWDWDRPQTGQRVLHIEKSLAVAKPDALGQLVPCPEIADGERVILTRCSYFILELLMGKAKVIKLDTFGESFHALTVLAGKVRLQSQADSVTLEKYQTALVPAALGQFTLIPEEPYRLLMSYVDN
jgi:mannose-6-phosphate isomerase